MTLLKKRFKESGLKQWKLEEMFKLSPKTIYNWLNYKGIESFVIFLRLLIKFNININEFIDDYEKIKKKE